MVAATIEPAVRSAHAVRGYDVPWWRSYAYEERDGHLTARYIGIDTYPCVIVAGWMMAASQNGGQDYPASMNTYMEENPTITADDPLGGLFRFTCKQVKASLERTSMM